MEKIRIQKILAEASVASRRAAEQMILDGLITVNGSLVTALPCFVDPEADDIRVDGRLIRRRTGRKVHYLLNKPRGVVCTQRDPQGRPRATDLVPHAGRRIYCAGRLDLDSTGLVILTDDGELTEYLTHPRYGVQKTYVVEVAGAIKGEGIEKLKAGVYIDGKRTQGAKVKILRRGVKLSLLEIRISEGRNREVRRMLAKVGHKVRKLKRVAIGSITDRGLKIGHVRLLRPAEVKKLRGSGRTCTTTALGARSRPQKDKARQHDTKKGKKGARPL